MSVQILCYIVRAQLLVKRQKGKYSTAKQLNWPRGSEIVLILEKNIFFLDESTLSTFFVCNPIAIWRLKHEQIYPHYIDGWIKTHWSRIEATIS